MTPSADRADTQAPRRGWPRWVWIVAPAALIVLLACCGFGVYQLVLRFERVAAEERAKAAEERAKADALKYGIEDDAKKFVGAVLLWEARRASLLVVSWGGVASDAKLDRETGHWTVTGPYQWTRPHAGQKDLEADWEVIVYYAPTERPASTIPTTPDLAGWHMVSYTTLELDLLGRGPNGQLIMSSRPRVKFHPASKDNGEAK
jgi:hypothetical protein